MTAATCPWYRRWAHRRARWLDRLTLVPHLRAAVRAGRLRSDQAQRALRVHMDLSGQDHWRCPCGAAERFRVLHAFVPAVDSPPPLMCPACSHPWDLHTPFGCAGAGGDCGCAKELRP